MWIHGGSQPPIAPVSVIQHYLLTSTDTRHTYSTHAYIEAKHSHTKSKTTFLINNFLKDENGLKPIFKKKSPFMWLQIYHHMLVNLIKSRPYLVHVSVFWSSRALWRRVILAEDHLRGTSGAS